MADTKCQQTIFLHNFRMDFSFRNISRNISETFFQFRRQISSNEPRDRDKKPILLLKKKFFFKEVFFKEENVS